MSKYLELKSQMEALQVQIAAARTDEFDAQVADIKQRIAEFGITPEQLFGAAALIPKRVRRPQKYTLNGHTWSGQGASPKWYRDALRAGKTPEDMLIAKP